MQEAPIRQREIIVHSSLYRRQRREWTSAYATLGPTCDDIAQLIPDDGHCSEMEIGSDQLAGVFVFAGFDLDYHVVVAHMIWTALRTFPRNHPQLITRIRVANGRAEYFLYSRTHRRSEHFGN